MAYVKIIYQNSPSTATPINAQNLNHMDDGIAENDRRLNELETAGVVNKFNNRTGNVSPEKNDYDISLIGATAGEDGYVPVWRNSGTEEDPDWGFEMEAQGGAGHVLVDSDGNNMPSEDKMQFADAFLTDDSVNGKTVVENIKEVLPADYDSTTDEGIIVCDDGEDALIGPVSDDKVEVTADGVKTNSQLLNDLFNHPNLDISKITQNSTLVIAGEVLHILYATDSQMSYGSNGGASGSKLVDQVAFLNANGSLYEKWLTEANGTSSHITYSGNVAPSGRKYTLYYGNKKATVDLQTTANRCWYDANNTVKQALDIKELTVDVDQTISSHTDVNASLGAVPSGYTLIGGTWKRLAGGNSFNVTVYEYNGDVKATIYNCYTSNIAFKGTIKAYLVKTARVSS